MACYARDSVGVRVFEDSKGRIWASGHWLLILGRDRLVRWDPTTNALSSFEEEAQGLLGAFAEDRDGAIWMGYGAAGLVRYDGRQFARFNPGDGVPAGAIHALLVDSVGRLWIGSHDGGSDWWRTLAARNSMFAHIRLQTGWRVTRSVASWMTRQGASTPVRQKVWIV